MPSPATPVLEVITSKASFKLSAVHYSGLNVSSMSAPGLTVKTMFYYPVINCNEIGFKSGDYGIYSFLKD